MYSVRRRIAIYIFIVPPAFSIPSFALFDAIHLSIVSFFRKRSVAEYLHYRSLSFHIAHNALLHKNYRIDHISV